MIFEVRPFGPIATNSILLAVSPEKKAYIFDAPPGSCQYWEQRAKEDSLTIGGLFLTHSHWDHIVDSAEIKKKFGIPVWIHAEDADNLREPGSDGLPLLFSMTGVQPDHFLHDGEILALDGFSLRVLHTPGHTPGCVCFYWAEKGILIAGDTLFAGGIGRLDLSTARPHLMKASLQKLLTLPPKTRVFPGHGGPTSIEEETTMINYLCEEDL